MPIPLKLNAGGLRQQDIKRYWEDGFYFPYPRSARMPRWSFAAN